MVRHNKIGESRAEKINEYFVPSDAPPEDWGDDEQEWPVENIVEEDIDIFGGKQYDLCMLVDSLLLPLTNNLVTRQVLLRAAIYY